MDADYGKTDANFSECSKYDWTCIKHCHTKHDFENEQVNSDFIEVKVYLSWCPVISKKVNNISVPFTVQELLWF